MANSITSSILENGILFGVERDNTLLYKLKGLPTLDDKTSNFYVGFYPNDYITVHHGDWIINPRDERYYVSKVITEYIQGEESQIRAYCVTEYEYQHSIQASPLAVNVNGDLIKNQLITNIQYATTISELRSTIETSNQENENSLNEIIGLLEKIVNNQLVPEQGILSKFSDVFEKNSWLTGSVASTLLNWLLSLVN